MTHIDKPSDLWETPRWLMDELRKEFRFFIDLCATRDNKKAILYAIDYLKDEYTSTNQVPAHPIECFMNPPYSNPLPFVKKAFGDIQKGKFKAIVCLLKCDTSTKTWAVFWDYEKHHPKPGVEIRYLPKRLKFERGGVAGQSAPFPSVIVIMRNQNERT